MEVYNAGDVSLKLLPVGGDTFELKDWVTLTREDVQESEFDVEFGINNEPFVEISGNDSAMITVSVLQNSITVKLMTEVFNLQRIGVIGFPLFFKSKVEDTLYPVCILANRGKKVDSALGQAVEYVIKTTTQFGTSLLS